MRAPLDRLRHLWGALVEAAPSALGGLALIVGAASVVLLAGLALAALIALLY